MKISLNTVVRVRLTTFGADQYNAYQEKHRPPGFQLAKEFNIYTMPLSFLFEIFGESFSIPSAEYPFQNGIIEAKRADNAVVKQLDEMIKERDETITMLVRLLKNEAAANARKKVKS